MLLMISSFIIIVSSEGFSGQLSVKYFIPTLSKEIERGIPVAFIM